MAYRVEIEPDESFWLLYIPGIGQYTQARDRGEVAFMARDCIATTLDVPIESVEVEVVER